MRRSPGTLIATVGALAMLALLPATALASGPKPAVEEESTANVTATDATLEARIDPGSGEDGFSLETTYEFFLESPWCGTRGTGFCEASGGVLVYKGVLPSGSKPQLVSVDLASVGHALSQSTTYGYRVVASNEVGEAFGGEHTFATPVVGPPLPCVEDPQDCKPLGLIVTPGPASDKPEAPLGGGQHATSGGSTFPAAADGSAAVASKPAHGKPSSKHGKRHRGKHHGTKAAKRPRGKRHKR